MSLARESHSNNELRLLLRERCNSVCWAHCGKILYILDKEGNLIECDPLKEEFHFVKSDPVLRRHLRNAGSGAEQAKIKPHAIGIVIFLKKIILLVRINERMAELITEYHLETHSCLHPVQFANDSYAAWTEANYLMQIEATGE